MRAGQGEMDENPFYGENSRSAPVDHQRSMLRNEATSLQHCIFTYFLDRKLTKKISKLINDYVFS